MQEAAGDPESCHSEGANREKLWCEPIPGTLCHSCCVLLFRGVRGPL